MWCDALVNGICIRPVRETNDNVRVLEPEPRIYIGGDFVIGFENILDVYVHEIVEGINVLLHEPLDFEEGREQQPFVLRSVVS